VFRRHAIADIAVLACARALPGAGLALTDRPAIGAWIARVQSRPRFAAMIR
jgi:glutathione S-transferase